MQRIQSNCATFEVASSMLISARATADEINCALPNGKQRGFWRKASLSFLGSLTVAGFLVAAAPFPTRADNDEDSRHGHENNDKGIRAEIVALKAEVADPQNQVNSLQASNTTLKNQLAAVESNPALALGPFVTVDPNPENEVVGPNIIFKGANIHVVSGSGTTVDNNGTGLGNLIIGYDELPPQGFPRRSVTATAAGHTIW